MGAATALPIGRFLVLMGEINQLVGGLSVVCGRSKDAQSILKKKLRSSHQLETTTRNRLTLLDRLPNLALCTSCSSHCRHRGERSDGTLVWCSSKLDTSKSTDTEGVDDLVDNVWELVEGSWTIYPWSDADPRSPTRGPLTRGGSWVTPGSNASSYRGAWKGNSAMVGFRCAMDVSKGDGS